MKFPHFLFKCHVFVASWEELMYQQTFATAMESLVSMTVGITWSGKMWRTLRALASADVVLKFWKRYVDDTCICVALPASQCEVFLKYLNSVEPTIQFTLESELDGKLPFLDILFKHLPDRFISTSIFRKVTHTDKYMYLDFSSHPPSLRMSLLFAHCCMGLKYCH